MTVRFPKVSIITPTLNSQRTLAGCLNSIRKQDYPGPVEIIIADGGSQDETLNIAKSAGARRIHNKLETGEAGKAVGVKVARGEILAFIDSDNILPNDWWLKKMVKPFLDDKNVVASEPLFFTYRRRDHWLTRYFALLGMGDPLNLFIGNYDRYSFVSDKWTGIKLHTENKKGYKVLFLKQDIPTIGANGFLIRREGLKNYPIKDYLFDIDILRFLAKTKVLKVAKVNVGIVHLFSGDISTFVRKQRRRIRDYFFFRKAGVRALEMDRTRKILGIAKFVLATILVVPLLFQGAVGYFRKRDNAWLFHPLACWLTLGTYSLETIRAFFVQQQFKRKGWRQ